MGIVFKIALTNVFWEYGGEDTRYFSTLEEQKAYFDNLIGGNLSPLFNFQINDSLSTVVYFKDTTGRNIIESLRCNYAIVIAYDEETNEELTRKYYFAKVYQDSNIQLRVELDLDDIQTNYISFRHLISDCVINRCSINRWKKGVFSGGTRYYFNSNVDSDLYVDENIQEPSKRLTYREELKFKFNNQTVSDWYNNNIIGWEYYFLNNRPYNFERLDNNNTQEFKPRLMYQTLKETNTQDDDNKLESPLIVMATPVYKNYSSTDTSYSNAIVIKNEILVSGSTKYFVLNKNGMKKFRDLNNNSSYFYSKKFSIKPPIDFLDMIIGSDNYIDENNNLIINTYGVEDGVGFTSTNGYFFNIGVNTNTTEKFNTGIVCLEEDKDYYLPLTFSKDLLPKFTKEEILESGGDYNYNPKLYSLRFKNLDVVIGNERFSYDILKLGLILNEPIIGYTEAITPDITKAYARFMINYDDYVYTSGTSRNFTGCVQSADYSMMFDNDKLSQMLAENKNYYLQQIYGIGSNTFSGLFNAGMKDKPIKAGAGLVSTGVDLINGVVNLTLNVDNMRNAPKDLKNVSGNVYFQGKVQSLMPAIEIYDILPTDKKSINDYMKLYGFNYGKIGHPEEFLQIYTKFDYISCEVKVISAPLSSDEKYRLKQRLKGVRFWYEDVTEETNYFNNIERNL